MTEPRHRATAEKRRRRRELTGLAVILAGGLVILATLIVVLGWWSTGLLAGVGLIMLGWSLAASEDTGPGSRDSRDRVVEVDTDVPDPGQFIPGQVPGQVPADPPGTFYPPPPSRDSGRDFERDDSRDH